jgi:hypothetical protein
MCHMQLNFSCKRLLQNPKFLVVLAKRKNHAPQEGWVLDKWENTSVYEKLPKITTWSHMSRLFLHQ